MLLGNKLMEATMRFIYQVDRACETKTEVAGSTRKSRPVPFPHARATSRFIYIYVYIHTR